MIHASFEHVAINVPEKEGMADWYVRHLGLTVVRDVPEKMIFLADADGKVILELYNNTSAGNLPLNDTEPLALHIAFVVSDPESAADELVRAGATMEVPLQTVGDDTMVMLRDPFGLPLQLVKRGKPMRRVL